MVELAPVDDHTRPKLLALAPTPEQEIYSGHPSATLPSAEADPERQPVAVLDDGEPAGFFVLDCARQEYDPQPGVVAMRAFFVDAARQGLGIGREALRLLPDFVRAHHPGARRVSLTVNLRNDVALRAYERANFIDTGRLYHGGRAGAQRVLTLPL